jgi:hypothetical protein
VYIIYGKAHRMKKMKTVKNAGNLTTKEPKGH